MKITFFLLTSPKVNHFAPELRDEGRNPEKLNIENWKPSVGWAGHRSQIAGKDSCYSSS